MLWFKKPSKATQEVERDLIAPAELPVPLDAGLFQQHLAALQQASEPEGGVEAYLAGLAAKQALFAAALTRDRIDVLDLEKVEILLDTVFPARRRIFPVLEAMGEAALQEAVQALLYGAAPLAQRLQEFVEALPVPTGLGRESVKAAGKLKRAGFDFAAELLHFLDPEKYPLMARWVWDQTTVSGALREFIRGNDQMPEIALGTSPEMFEGARAWLAQRIAEQGIFREVHFWIDLVLAQAYVTYLRSVAEGNLGGDFGRGAKPGEQLRKLLGIDAPRKDGKLRVKKAGLGMED